MKRTFSELSVGVGLVLGAGVGTTAAILAGFDLATGTAYGTGGGVVLGAILGRLLDRRTAAGERLRAWLFGPALGAVVGAAVGVVGAWSVEAALLDGVVVGGLAGVALGVLLGGVLEATARSDDDVAEAGEQTV